MKFLPAWFAKPGSKSAARLRLARVAAITAAVAAICGYLDLDTPVFEMLEQKTYGERLEVAAEMNRPLMQRARDQIVLVTISDRSYQWASHGQQAGPVFPRADHARLIHDLTHYGAKVIAFDMVFDTPQPGDADLSKAIRQSGRVLLACADQGEERPKIMMPESVLEEAGAQRGHTRVMVNPERPAIDRIVPVIVGQGQSVTALSVEAARMARGRNEPPPPVDEDGTFKIRYLSAPGQTFTSFAYEEICDCPAPQKQFYLDSGTFKDKIVLIGDITRINKDNGHLTPVGEMPGVEIQAYALATLLEGRFLRDAPRMSEFMQIVTLAFLAALLASVWRLRRAALFLVLLLPAYFVFNVAMFVERDLVLPLVAPAVTIVLTALGVLLERGLVEEQEKTRMRGLLQRYVSPQIAAHILKHPELLGRAGTRGAGTVLFADIRGFTALSEQIPPEELVRRMNEYFDMMTDIVFRHDGTAASIVGDALMALFGIPVPYPDHARRAVAAAIEMQDALALLQQQWRAQGESVFDIGIGINTGEMVVGDVGGRQLTSFTVYGLQVNIASRVESLNKQIGSRILVTRATYESVAAEIEARGPLSSPVKGMEKSLEVFEVLGWRKSQGKPSLTRD